MRCFYGIIMLVFIQVLSLQFALGKTHSALKNKPQKKTVIVDTYLYKFSKKQHTTVKKILFEDLPFVQHTVKKPGLGCCLFSATLQKPGNYQLLTTRTYGCFTSSCYSFIFDHLYPKHVFW
ncbi:hypothetical protein Phep_3550 [Pedobacter heparinus DSM 2366]|uniref:Uncharacterized protein n=1 Tax=Pedobacter heparinus (strain ATCC 13125 / DSM 2366 / CIP 104194 / JCM 7457 / NBRC 12017 / NCIMB 9290 / NRRL B-14731 / HIM 762-3) TaxID=485917 RepID=C6XTG3_PEDHD|nr:hypothetical protein Phep_3550 [Pedobacter heparinus DSM 2366]